MLIGSAMEYISLVMKSVSKSFLVCGGTGRSNCKAY